MLPLATKLNKNGISLRFINFRDDFNFDNITDATLDTYMDKIKPRGSTKLGRALNEKVVTPLVDSLQFVETLRPTLVSIITDGEVSITKMIAQIINQKRNTMLG